MNPEEDAKIRIRYAEGISYKELKDLTYEKILAFVTPIQKNFATIDDKYVLELLNKNAAEANNIANKKIDQVYKAMGLR